SNVIGKPKQPYSPRRHGGTGERPKPKTFETQRNRGRRGKDRGHRGHLALWRREGMRAWCARLRMVSRETRISCENSPESAWRRREPRDASTFVLSRILLQTALSMTRGTGIPKLRPAPFRWQGLN